MPFIFIFGIMVLFIFATLPLIIGVIIEGEGLSAGWGIANVIWLMFASGIIYARDR